MTPVISCEKNNNTIAKLRHKWKYRLETHKRWAIGPIVRHRFDFQRPIQSILIWVSKNADLDAEFESVKKLQKRLQKESLGLRTFVHSTVLKGEKVHISYTFMTITFLQLFQWIQNQHQILRFLIPISK
jgi:hypothetical protein